MVVVQFSLPSSVDLTCEQNRNAWAVKSVNDGRPGAEQAEAEGTEERGMHTVNLFIVNH